MKLSKCSSSPVAHLVSALLWQRDSAVPWLRSFRVPTSDAPVFSSPFNLLHASYTDLTYREGD